MKRLIYLLLGVFCCGMGFSIIIIYFNLLLYGFGFFEFIKMILKTWEFYMIFIGIYFIKKR